MNWKCVRFGDRYGGGFSRVNEEMLFIVSALTLLDTHMVDARRIVCEQCDHNRGLSSETVFCRACNCIDVSLIHGRCRLQKWSSPDEVGVAEAESNPDDDSAKLITDELHIATTFDRVVCINLDRSSDRWALFQEELTRIDWPFREVERFRAVDASKLRPPKWWRAGRGAWGCHQSHVRILEDALQDGIESLLILEDDVTFCDGFNERFSAFLQAVPQDWDGLMLGGEHVEPPVVVLEGSDTTPAIVGVTAAVRTHAHAYRGRYMSAAYRHLCNYAEHIETPSLHVDSRLSGLHATGRYRIYAPSPFLAGQAEGVSTIQGAHVPVRYWNSELGKQEQ